MEKDAERPSAVFADSFMARSLLSPGNSKKEMREKFEVYEEAGVREYWLVNPLDNVVLVYVLNEAGKYIGLAPVTENQELRAAIFPDLVIDLKEVFG